MREREPHWIEWDDDAFPWRRFTRITIISIFAGLLLGASTYTAFAYLEETDPELFATSGSPGNCNDPSLSSKSPNVPERISPNITLGHNWGWYFYLTVLNDDENHTITIKESGFRLVDDDGLRHTADSSYAYLGGGKPFPLRATLSHMEFAQGVLMFPTASDISGNLTLIYDERPIYFETTIRGTGP